MDKFAENLAAGIRRFAMAGVGAVSLTVDKSKEIISQLVERGEVTASEGQIACDELQKKLSEQLSAFSQKLKADYENASFARILETCDKLTPEQKEQLIQKLTAQPDDASAEECEAAEECGCTAECCEAETAADAEAEPVGSETAPSVSGDSTENDADSSCGADSAEPDEP